MGGIFDLIIGVVFKAALLWLLITFYTRQTSSDQSWREAQIVLMIFLAVSIAVRLFLGNILGLFVVLIEVGALYVIVDRVCETPKRVTIRICAWYFSVMFLVALFFYFLGSLLTQ